VMPQSSVILHTQNGMMVRLKRRVAAWCFLSLSSCCMGFCTRLWNDMHYLEYLEVCIHELYGYWCWYLKTFYLILCKF
jgi:hypothetical protein